MRSSEPGRANYGAMAGAAVGAIGGLFALGVGPAISLGDARLLFNTPKLNMICWVVSLGVGWMLGSLLGPIFGRKFGSERAEIAGGVVAGFITVALGIGTGWLLWQWAPE